MPFCYDDILVDRIDGFEVHAVAEVRSRLVVDVANRDVELVCVRSKIRRWPKLFKISVRFLIPAVTSDGRWSRLRW